MNTRRWCLVSPVGLAVPGFHVMTGIASRCIQRLVRSVRRERQSIDPSLRSDTVALQCFPDVVTSGRGRCPFPPGSTLPVVSSILRYSHQPPPAQDAESTIRVFKCIDLEVGVLCPGESVPSRVRQVHFLAPNGPDTQLPSVSHAYLGR